MDITTLTKVCCNLEADIYNRFIPFHQFHNWETLSPEKQFSAYEKVEKFMNNGKNPAIPRFAKINFTKPGIIGLRKAKVEAVIVISAALKVARFLKEKCNIQ
jgi:hypothetical protein